MRAECRLVMPFFCIPSCRPRPVNVPDMDRPWLDHTCKAESLAPAGKPRPEMREANHTDVVSPQDKSLPLPRHDCMGQSGVEPDARHDQVTNNTCGAILRQLVCTLYVPAPQPSASPNTQWNKCVVNLCMIVRIHM